jgi:hypothetical protein
MRGAGLFLAAVLAVSASGLLAADVAQLKAAVGDGDLVGEWIYDDVNAGFAAATKSGKPLFIVLRCVP